MDRQHIEKILAVISGATKVSGAKWVIGGSAGLLLRGCLLAEPPNDLDLYADEADADQLHQLLLQYAVDEPQWSETGIYKSKLSHYVIAGTLVELVGGFEITALHCRYQIEVHKYLVPYSKRIPLFSFANIKLSDVNIVPLAHELWFNVLRERTDRTQLIMQSIASDIHKHLPALLELERRNSFTEDARRRVHDRISQLEAGIVL